MERITADELRNLASLQVKPRLTLYMPTNPGSPKGMQDTIRLRDLADQGERELIAAEVRPTVARELIAKVRDLPAKPEFWQARNQSLAVLLAEDTFVAWRLSSSLDEFVAVGPRFLLKPLLYYQLSDRKFLVLSLSRQGVNLYRGSRDSFEEVPVPGMPPTLDAALNIDSTDRGEQVRSIRRGDGGKENAVFHGQGGKPDTHKLDFERYLVEVERALGPVLKNERDPLLLVGVDYQLTMFRNSCTYRGLLPTQLDGSPERLSPHELHARAWKHLGVIGQADEPTRELDRYRRAVGNGSVSRELRDIVPAAVRGDLEVLFVDPRRAQWGAWNPETNVLIEHAEREPMDDDLLDLAAMGTHLSKGKVFFLPAKEMPDPSGIAAIYRAGRIPWRAQATGTP